MLADPSVCQPVGMPPGYNKVSKHWLNLVSNTGVATVPIATNAIFSKVIHVKINTCFPSVTEPGRSL